MIRSRIGRQHRQNYITSASGGGEPVISSLLDIVSSSKILAYYRSDTVLIETGVSQWTDLSGNGYHLTQGTGAKQPSYNLTSGSNSTPEIIFDGSNDTLANTSLQLPTASALGNVLYYGVIKQHNWGGNRTVICAGRSTAWECGLYQAGTTPQLAQANVTGAQNLNGASTIDSWSRLKAFYDGGGAGHDYIKLKSTTVSTGAPGTNAPDQGLWLASRVDVAGTVLD